MFWGNTLLVFVLFFVFGAQLVPSVNETHYTLKAAAFWGLGALRSDLFLGSSDTHWLYFLIFGAPARWFDLEAVAWIGRITGWFGLALAWCLVLRRWSLPLGVPMLIAGCWLAISHYCQLSGEWVVGGGEAKVFAYIPALLAWAMLASPKPWRAWPLLGIASAFHVLVGGWSVVVGLIALLVIDPRGLGKHKSQHALGLILGGVCALPGVLPALQTTSEATPEMVRQAAELYVYKRIPHHLCFTKFALHRQLAFLAPLGGLVVLSWLSLSQRKVTVRADVARTELKTEEAPFRPEVLLAMAWVAIALGVVGIVIELGGNVWGQPASAVWLRYYWFRLIDPLVPFAIVLPIAWNSWLRSSAPSARQLAISIGALPSQLESFASNKAEMARNDRWSSLFLAACLVLTIAVILPRFSENMQAKIPEPDLRMLALKELPKEEQYLLYRSWLAACRFVRKSTPEDSLWITPRRQQTFKWYARRPEVMCWKDVPQDAKSMLEWYQRFETMHPVDETGKPRGWTTEELLALGKKYGAKYAIVDRRIQVDPPLLPMIYPINGESNSYYAIFELP